MPPVTALIREAVRVLKRGGVVALPTETTYGLACDPRNAKAVAKIFKIKGRDRKKRLLLVASSMQQVKKVVKITGVSLGLAHRHWPGPLTLVLPAKKGKEEIAIRVTSSPIASEVARLFGSPIVATSANRSGKPECRSATAVARAFSKQKIQPDFILDGGMLPRRKPSTVAKIGKDGVIEMLRRGSIRL
jgi:L-threonylcarbamoyladenylate synthase